MVKTSSSTDEDVGGGNGTPDKYKKKQQEEEGVVGEELMTDELSKEVELSETINNNGAADQNKESTSPLRMLSALFGMGTSDDKPQDKDDEELIDDNVPEEEEAKSSTNKGDADTTPPKDIKSIIKENLLKDHFLDLKKSVDEDDTGIMDTKKKIKSSSKQRSLNLPPKVALTGILKNTSNTKNDSPTANATVDSMGFPLSTSSKSWESDFFSGSNPFVASSSSTGIVVTWWFWNTTITITTDRMPRLLLMLIKMLVLNLRWILNTTYILFPILATSTTFFVTTTTTTCCSST